MARHAFGSRMIGGPKVSADGNSTAVGGDNSGVIVNNAGGTLNLNFTPDVARQLPSFLAQVITFFSQQSLAEYDAGPRRELPPEAILKVEYNNLPSTHPVLTDYRSYSLVLETAYHGVEQQNADAHRLVRRKAGVVYKSQLQAACTAASIPNDNQATFATQHAAALIEGVINQLLNEYAQSKTSVHVESEIAHLAISLIVADAIVECDVLERPLHAASA
jgi:hypothetical protein